MSDIDKFNLAKLERDINNILKNQEGIYSIAYQNTTSKEKLLINSKKMQSASMIKIFIMIEAFCGIKENKLNGDNKVILLNSMKVGGAGSLAEKEEDTEVTINDLINLMITESDNTASNILIDIVTMDRINARARKLGCLDTIIQRKMMDLKAITEGKDNFTSVLDLCNVLIKIYKGQCIDEEYDKKMIEIMQKQQNNTKIPLLLPAGTIVANKTGELHKVENDAGIILNKKSAYILCILSNEVDSASAISIISRLSKIIYDQHTKY